VSHKQPLGIVQQEVVGEHREFDSEQTLTIAQQEVVGEHREFDSEP
jgi:hypothetical protein